LAEGLRRHEGGRQERQVSLEVHALWCCVALPSDRADVRMSTESVDDATGAPDGPLGGDSSSCLRPWITLGNEFRLLFEAARKHAKMAFFTPFVLPTGRPPSIRSRGSIARPGPIVRLPGCFPDPKA
jgi:hypothetical protein